MSNDISEAVHNLVRPLWNIAFFAIVALIGRLVAKHPPKKLKISDDGHYVPKDQDLTCDTKYGHNHGEPEEKQYIVHEEPTEGYVVLNGVKRNISDCKRL